MRITSFNDDDYNNAIFKQIKTPGRLAALKGKTILEIDPVYTGYYSKGKPLICGVSMLLEDKNGRKSILNIDNPEPFISEEGMEIDIQLATTRT